MKSGLQRWLVYWVTVGLDECDMTQAELAERAGMSRQQLSSMLNGHAEGKLEVWDRLLAIVGVRDSALRSR